MLSEGIESIDAYRLATIEIDFNIVILRSHCSNVIGLNTYFPDIYDKILFAILYSFVRTGDFKEQSQIRNLLLFDLYRCLFIYYWQ